MVKENQDPLAIVLGRRSVRVYAPGNVPPEKLQDLLKAAMAAPSAMAKDPWRFVTIVDKPTLAKLPAILPGGAMLGTAAAAILVAGDLDAAFERNLSYLLQDCSAAIENLLLAAHALGLGACWVGVHPGEQAIRAVKDLFGLPASFVPVAVVSLGLPGEAPEPRTRFNANYVRAESWEPRA